MVSENTCQKTYGEKMVSQNMCQKTDGGKMVSVSGIARAAPFGKLSQHGSLASIAWLWPTGHSPPEVSSQVQPSLCRPPNNHCLSHPLSQASWPTPNAQPHHVETP